MLRKRKAAGNTMYRRWMSENKWRNSLQSQKRDINLNFVVHKCWMKKTHRNYLYLWSSLHQQVNLQFLTVRPGKESWSEDKRGASPPAQKSGTPNSCGKKTRLCLGIGFPKGQKVVEIVWKLTNGTPVWMVPHICLLLEKHLPRLVTTKRHQTGLATRSGRTTWCMMNHFRRRRHWGS